VRGAVLQLLQPEAFGKQRVLNVFASVQVNANFNATQETKCAECTPEVNSGSCLRGSGHGASGTLYAQQLQINRSVMQQEGLLGGVAVVAFT